MKRKLIRMFNLDHNCQNVRDISEPTLLNYKQIPEKLRRKQMITRLLYEERNHFRNLALKQRELKPPVSILSAKNYENQPKTRLTLYDNAEVRYDIDTVSNNRRQNAKPQLYRNPYETEKKHNNKKVRFVDEDSKIVREMFTLKENLCTEKEEVEVNRQETVLVKLLKKLLQKFKRPQRNQQEEFIENKRRPTMRVPEVHANILKQKYKTKKIETKESLETYQITYV